MFYSRKDADDMASVIQDDYGELYISEIQKRMNKCWRAGLWSGMFLAATPGISLIIIGWLS